MTIPFRYSYSNFVYGNEPMEKSAARLADCGYDGIEIVGEPDRYDLNQLRRVVDSYGLEVSSIGSIYSSDRDFSAASPQRREGAETYVRRIADMAAATGAPVAIFAPASCGRTHGGPEGPDQHARMVESMRRAAEYAGTLGVDLAIEAWNRYETHFLNRLGQAADLAREIDLPNVGVMADVFHMNIEDGSIADAIRDVAPLLMHVHLSDTNRSVPGSGHLDFAPILSALREIGYDRYLTFELLPASADPISVLESGGAEAFRDPFTRDAIEFLRRVESELAAEAGV
jgi:sugar phosphate isomerase/epimerase